VSPFHLIALTKKLSCKQSQLKAICSRSLPALYRSLGRAKGLKDLKSSSDQWKSVMKALPSHIMLVVPKEIEAWIRRALKELRPLRQVILKKLKELIGILYGHSPRHV